MALKDALKKLNDAVADLTSLHVQTFSGELDFEVTGSESFKELRDKVKNSNANGTIKLVAESLSQFDGDSYNFVKQDLEEIPALALEVHKNAVQTGIETRIGLLKLFKDLIVS